MRIKTKILLPMMIITILVAAAILISNVILFSDYVDREIIDTVNAAAAVAGNNLETLKIQAETASKYIAENDGIINALADNNHSELLEQAAKLQNEMGVEFCTIADNSGIAVLRTHEPENYGDSVASQANVQSAMSGKSLTAVETGTAVRLSVRSGSPVFYDNGDIIGVVSVGFRLDTERFVDSVKNLAACESTIFLGDERISTTVTDGNRVRATGTKADSHISGIVLGGGSYTGAANILDRNAVANYSPLTDAGGNAIGIAMDDFGVGHSSLLYLRTHPITTLKIDGSLSWGVTEHPENLEIISTIHDLCNVFNVDTIIEYVDNEKQLEKLMSVGTFLIQGYFFSKPLAGDEVPAFAANWKKN